MEVKARAMRFVDFELGMANEFLYPRTWNDATISIGFNGTDGSIFTTDFVVESGSGINVIDSGADNVEIEYHNRSLCDFDVRGFSEKVKLGENIKYTSDQYLAVLPALFDIELKIKGIVVVNTSGFIYQIREVIAFRSGKEETGSFFPMMKTGADLFPALRLDTKLDVDVVATIGYPLMTLAILIGLLCIVLAIWVLLRRIIDYKNSSAQDI